MADLTAQRTLVKSPPELWSELSEVESLAKHLGELGEIRITKVEPESTVAWEGEEVSGTVALEQSGWGTKVTFTATVPEPGPADLPAPAEPEPAAVAVEHEPVVVEPVAVEPEPVAVEPAPVEREPEPKRQGFLARWLFRQRTPRGLAVDPTPVAIEQVPALEPTPAPEPVVDPEPQPQPEPEPEPLVANAEAERIQRILDGTLEALGQAHHRPFSRG
ncbi:MAG TPA: hypothetical protein VHF88_07285 [Thermoleophilaceae bacterium]|nr:hypothetical protein [Thermoleophilaceae bacterium]